MASKKKSKQVATKGPEGKLRQQDVKEYRERELKKQKGICPLCRTSLLFEDATLEHCHSTGYIRGVLHRSCNSGEGRVLTWAGKRSRGDDPELWLRNLLRYWKKDYSENPIHHTHGRKKRRKKRVKRKKK